MKKILGLNKNNFILNVKSKRISKKRLKVHKSINVIKKKFKLWRYKHFFYLKNKDDIDLITHEPIKNIPLKDLLILNVNNMFYGISAYNLFKWISMFSWDTIPLNPFTNKSLNMYERHMCYCIAYNFSKINNKLNYENLELFKKFNFNEFYRINPYLLHRPTFKMKQGVLNRNFKIW